MRACCYRALAEDGHRRPPDDGGIGAPGGARTVVDGSSRGEGAMCDVLSLGVFFFLLLLRFCWGTGDGEGEGGGAVVSRCDASVRATWSWLVAGLPKGNEKVQQRKGVKRKRDGCKESCFRNVF